MPAQASTDFQNYSFGKKWVRRVWQVDKRHLGFQPLELWKKPVLKSARAKRVNKFLEEKLQLCAATRICAQLAAAVFGGGRVFPKTDATVAGVRTCQQHPQTKVAGPDGYRRSLATPDVSSESHRHSHPQPHATFTSMQATCPPRPERRRLARSSIQSEPRVEHPCVPPEGGCSRRQAGNDAFPTPRGHAGFIPILDRFWVAEFVLGHFR